jgi:hypothetical protein
MRKPRPRHWKYTVPLAQLAETSGLSLSLIKKLSANHPSLAEWLESSERYVQELESALGRAERAITGIHFRLVDLRSKNLGNQQLSDELTEILGITGPFVEED